MNQEPAFSSSVSEMHLFRVYAEDADNGNNAELEYSIIDFDPPIAKNFFEIEKYSGRVISRQLLKGHQLQRFVI